MYFSENYIVKFCSLKFFISRKIPYLVMNNDWCRLWFMQDNDFKLPKLNTRIAFKSPMMQSDPLNSYLSAMFVICLQVISFYKMKNIQVTVIIGR